MVDGKPINQDYVQDPPTYPVDESTGSKACGGPYFGPVKVPEDSIWVMGITAPHLLILATTWAIISTARSLLKMCVERCSSYSGRSIALVGLMTQTSNPKPQQQRLRTRDFLAPVIGGFVLLVLLQAFVGRMYVIPSASMEPTLHGCTGCDNDRIAVQKLSYYFHDPAPGDVVVFEGPESWNTEFEVQRSENVLMRGAHNVLASVGLLPNGENILVKRVIATEGQTVKCEEGDSAVMVDGAPIDQSFTLIRPRYRSTPAMGRRLAVASTLGPSPFLKAICGSWGITAPIPLIPART